MARRRTHIGKILVTAFCVLLLCSVVAAEIPEFVSLLDDTSNDFTVRRTNTVDLLVSVNASMHLQIAEIESESPATQLLFSRLGTLEKAASVTSEPSILHSVLRT